VKNAVQEEAVFPASCCQQEFPTNEIKRLLAPHIGVAYKTAAVRFAVPSGERVFCSRGCGAFLGSSASAKSILCQECNQATCTVCKEKEHSGECLTADSALEELARKQGWQTCSGCKAIVELGIGCNHISYVYTYRISGSSLTPSSCRCGNQFCYVCGAVWKTCGCQQWTEHRLQHALQFENGNEPPAGEEARCDRHDWVYGVGRRRCGDCGRTRYHYRCRGCAAITCRECRDRAGNYGIHF
jgi:hypothetical protein